MPNSAKIQVGLRVPTPQWRGMSVLLRVLGLASGVCLALGPEFPEIAHRGPSLNWSGGGISPLGELLTVVVCLFVCVCGRGWAW